MTVRTDRPRSPLISPHRGALAHGERSGTEGDGKGESYRGAHLGLTLPLALTLNIVPGPRWLRQCNVPSLLDATAEGANTYGYRRPSLDRME